MATPTNQGWKTCSRGHKYRGARCTACWKGESKPTRADSPSRKKSTAKLSRSRAHSD